jgi:hypothetical protein
VTGPEQRSTSIILCIRGGRPPRAKCGVCHVRVHERLCDGPGKRAGATCNKRLCLKCARTVGEKDFCPRHPADQLELPMGGRP